MIDLLKFLDYNLQGKIQIFLFSGIFPVLTLGPPEDTQCNASCNASLRDCKGNDHRDPTEIPQVFVLDLKEASKGAVSKCSGILGDRVCPRKTMKQANFPGL